MIEERRAEGHNPFPHKFDVTISLGDFIEKYDPVLKENGQILADETVRVAGLLKTLHKNTYKALSFRSCFLEKGSRLKADIL